MTLPDLIKATIRAMWRRRAIMLAPLLIIIPLSVVAALLWPTRFETNTLILLQEYSGLTSTAPSYLRAQELTDKVKSLETLVKSEHIITRTLARHENQELTHSQLEEYRSRLSVDQVGNQFVRLSLIGKQAEGLGDELSLILTTLFESLLTADTNALNAPRFVITKHRQALADIEKRLAQSPAANSGATLAEITAQQAAVETASRTAEEAAARTSTARQELEGRTTAAGLTVDIANGSPAQILNGLESALKARQEAGDTAGAENITSLITVARGLEETVQAGERALQQQAAANAKLEELRQSFQQRNNLEAEAQSLRARIALFEQRLTSAGQQADIQLLSAPAQIQIIDTPKDPRQRLNSRIKILIAGILAAFAMAGAFALLAEQLDNRLRGRNMLHSLTDLPLVAAFPRGAFETGAEPMAHDPPRPDRRATATT